MDFRIKGNEFFLDGKPIRLYSGAVHYFRNMPDTWRDIFRKMKALGLNCVESYCAWNAHEKKEGEFDFSRNLDIRAFVKTAAEEGLLVIIRPGPYICAEWEFGGLPWWLQSVEGLEIRCSCPLYMERFARYLHRLFDELRDLLCTNGGPIIMMQCENEYGYYGDDKAYLSRLYEIYREGGIDVPLFTSDGIARENLLDGAIAGCLPTLNFGSRVEEAFRAHDALYPDVPKMCMEMWCGWFDAWGDEEHHTRDAEEYAGVVADMLKKGSFNIYMFIGGTNFGFMNGANHYEHYAPTVTSYDYDALLTECGDVTEKYRLVRRVMEEHLGRALPPIPKSREKRAYGEVRFSEQAGLLASLACLASPIFSEVPHPMEQYGQGYGYIAYKTTLSRDCENAPLSFESIGDRAHIFVNGTLMGILYINDEKLTVNVTAKAGDTLTVLVENMGRANFGSKMMRKKGIVGRVTLGQGIIHFGWQVYPLPMDDLSPLVFGASTDETCAFYRGHFTVDVAKDTFLYIEGAKKGFAVLNGFHLGRFWSIGPQKSLYVPASLLHEGENELLLFSSDGTEGEVAAEFTAYPTL